MADRPTPWVAFALTFLEVGLGQVYAGRPARGVGIAVAALLGVAPALHWALGASADSPYWVLLSALLLLLALAINIGIAFDGARIARMGRRRLHRTRHRLLAMGAFLIATALVGEALDAPRKRAFGQSYHVPSESMLPSLLIGDHFMTRPALYRERSPEPGDIVVVRLAREGRRLCAPDRCPGLPTESFIRRIVATAGDSIVVDAPALFVNGTRATGVPTKGAFSDVGGRAYLVLEERVGRSVHHVLDDPKLRGERTTLQLVEPGRYYLLGDNRDNSYDSRGYGTVAREDILGPVGRIYWSWPYSGSTAALFVPDTLRRAMQEVRWDRIGMLAGGSPLGANPPSVAE